MPWSLKFDEPIKLPSGGKLVTLKDAIAWLAKQVPKSEHGMKPVRRALRHRGRGERRQHDICPDGHDAGDQPAQACGTRIAKAHIGENGS